ncbi:conserved hypothetical protein [Pediculus humanus corporis]|uniref:Glycosyl transferase family 25 domain-containing protein n=1 Tax=Pediculus humanus subsp. corporis TaxID=121224 RepID=E0VF54_PEDHC|nr:uncharacterized protein Phum_PHUM149550 [Pediculus humanus corporis]EEB12010.1 conserved hypothetical protein [Pediculus humanus corporis]
MISNFVVAPDEVSRDRLTASSSFPFVFSHPLGAFKNGQSDVEILHSGEIYRTLTDEYLEELGIEFMPEYKDPYHKRAMTHGEIGCFLSHYFIWEKVLENKYDLIMVLEDDVQFEPYFREKITALLKEVEDLKLPWDLIYIGRKRLVEHEDWVKGSKSLVHVAYSYWTLGYLLTNEGARKLLEQKPLKKLIPVDEYIPILFDKHPEKEWKKHFPKRDLLAYSAAPLLLYPTHYTGEEGYISDTENSVIVKESQKEIREDL